LKKTEETLETMGELIAACRFKEAIKAAMTLAQEANRYLEEKSPWKVIKTDKQSAAVTLYVALTVISGLRTAFYPFLPFRSQKLHEYLGYEGKVEDDGWQLRFPSPGQKLLPPEPLFIKLDEEVVEQETDRLGKKDNI